MQTMQRFDIILFQKNPPQKQEKLDQRVKNKPLNEALMRNPWLTLTWINS